MLQPREFRLLEYLMKHAGQVVTRTMLLENVWDYHFDPQTNVIDVHISRLRSKIDKGFSQPLLRARQSDTVIRGAGYVMDDVTALGKLFRTTAFKLTLVYLTVFALFAAFLLGYFAWNTRRLITEQITETVDAEITGLSEQYRQGGIRRLVFVVDARARRPGSSLYLVTTPAGEGLAGNVGSLAAGHARQPRLDRNRLPPARRVEAASIPSTTRWCGSFSCRAASACWSAAISRSASGCTTSCSSAGRWSLAIVIVLGLAGGFFVTRRVLARVDAMTETTRTIMDGDLAGRLPVAGTGDELDRLADNLNAMLERIEALMHGLEGGLRQYRPRSQDAADAAAQSLPRRRCARPRTRRNTAPRWRARSRNPTG